MRSRHCDVLLPPVTALTVSGVRTVSAAVMVHPVSAAAAVHAVAAERAVAPPAVSPMAAAVSLTTMPLMLWNDDSPVQTIPSQLKPVLLPFAMCQSWGRPLPVATHYFFLSAPLSCRFASPVRRSCNEEQCGMHRGKTSSGTNASSLGSSPLTRQGVDQLVAHQKLPRPSSIRTWNFCGDWRSFWGDRSSAASTARCHRLVSSSDAV